MKIFINVFIILSICCLSRSIYQGRSASQSSSRFVVSIRDRRRDTPYGSGFLCAGTFISRHNVLTAASCVYGYRANDLQVSMGGTNLNLRYFYSNVNTITIHQNYSQLNPLNFNLAVLRISRVTSQRNSNRNPERYIESIRLAENDPVTPDSCRFLAWGNGNSLLQANLPIWPSSLCRNESEGIFCAGNIANGPAVCPRNLGGPLVCNNILAGFAIEDSGCTQSGQTGYFHSVHHHREWILASKASLSYEISMVLGFFAVFVQFKIV